jgi:hypothetical protein
VAAIVVTREPSRHRAAQPASAQGPPSGC